MVDIKRDQSWGEVPMSRRKATYLIGKTLGVLMFVPPILAACAPDQKPPPTIPAQATVPQLDPTPKSNIMKPEDIGPYDTNFFVVADGSYWYHPNWRPSYPESVGGELMPLYHIGRDLVNFSDAGPLQILLEVYLRRFHKPYPEDIIKTEWNNSRNIRANPLSDGHCADNVLGNINRPRPNTQTKIIEGVPVTYDTRQGLIVAEMAPIIPERMKEGDAGFKALFQKYAATPKAAREPFMAEMKPDKNGAIWYHIGLGISRAEMPDGEYYLLLVDVNGQIINKPLSQVRVVYNAKGSQRINEKLNLGFNREPLRELYLELVA